MKLFDRMRDETRGGIYDGIHDCTVNFKIWWNLVYRKSRYDYQIIAFWYWLNYRSEGS
jgi:hypothetical protein